MPLPLAVAATLCSSALFGLAFPPYDLRPLAFVCLVPLLLAVRSGGLARAVGLAWLWAVASAWAVTPFFASSIAGYYERPLWVGVLVVMGIFTGMAALYYMGFAWLDRALARRATLAGPLLTAAAWVSVELARGRLFTGVSFFTGNPWGLLGYTHASGSLAQVASWTGVYGISFAIVAVNAGLAGWIEAARDPGRSTRKAAAAALVAALPLVVFALGGALALRAAPAPAGAALREVAVIQGNVALGRRWRPEYYGKNLDVYLELTLRAIREGSPRTVVWPENAVSFFLEAEPLYQRAIARVLREGDVELLAGGPGRDGVAEARLFNSMFLLSPQGRITGRYDKQILVPFSEYYPFGSAAVTRRRTGGVDAFTHGIADPSPLPTRLGRAGMLTCNEAMLPELASARVRAGAEILISPAHDSWMVGMGYGEHMLAVVGLRAIEQRRYLVRASTSGPSAVFDPWGRTAVRTSVDRPYVLLGGVRPVEELTPYARMGDAFALGCAILVATALASGAARSRGRQGGRHRQGVAVSSSIRRI